MPFLTAAEIDAYMAPLSEPQAAAIRAIRAMILEQCPGLDEEVDTGKWYGGLLTYSSPEVGSIYALGPRTGGATTFHMMPFYGSELLQERHGEAFKKLITGKSCIQFKQTDQIPRDAIKDVLASTPGYVEKAKAFLEARSKKKRS